MGEIDYIDNDGYFKPATEATESRQIKRGATESVLLPCDSCRAGLWRGGVRREAMNEGESHPAEHGRNASYVLPPCDWLTDSLAGASTNSSKVGCRSGLKVAGFF